MSGPAPLTEDDLYVYNRVNRPSPALEGFLGVDCLENTNPLRLVLRTLRRTESTVRGLRQSARRGPAAITRPLATTQDEFVEYDAKPANLKASLWRRLSTSRTGKATVAPRWEPIQQESHKRDAAGYNR
jgi:hypothetical protein